MWLQSARDGGHGGNAHFAPPERRIYISLGSGHGFDALCDAALDLMEREVGGHPDRHDPVGFKWIVTQDEKLGGHVFAGSVYVVDRAFSGENEGVTLQFILPGFPEMGFGRIGRRLRLPVRTSQPFDWTAVNDDDFERLMFRLLFDMDDEFDNVQWLQRTRSPDSGRDISATRVQGGNRVMVQARHQQASITLPDVNDLLGKAQTWNPPFHEVMIMTTSAFTEQAVRFAENHNANPGTRPTLRLEPHGHLEVMLSRRPHLIAHLGLR